MVDLGVSFGDDTIPGVHVTMPDPSFIVEQRENLAGIVLTHAHEDHLGAVQYLWPQLRCPVYATPFSAVFLKAKLAEYGLDSQVPIKVMELGSRFDVGPFDIELVTMTHSILEPNALAIRTPKGMVLHSGDWKFDPDPLIGDASDQKRLAELGEEGVTALICDSTNALTEGSSGSESDVRDNLIKVIKEIKTGRVAVACFASNVARLQSIIEAAHEADRCVALVGRSLRRVIEAAQEVGYFKDYPNLLSEKDAMNVPRDQVLMICTGSQGEPRSALARIAKGDHPVVSLDSGDTVIFSSREIPGNEKSIGRMQNSLIAQGVEIITPGEHMIHVSGHPGRDELAQMYALSRPEIVVPVHGESRHTQAQAELAEACQVKETVVPFNGSVITLTPGSARIIDEVTSGELCVDGDRLVPRGGDLLKSRSRIIWNGIIFVTIVLDADGGLAADPLMSAPSLLDEDLDEGLIAMLLEQVEERVANLDDDQVENDDEVILAVRQAIRKPLRQRLGKRPLIEVHLVRAELDD
jgi:ribonuclease J